MPVETTCPHCGAYLCLSESDAWSLDLFTRLCDKCKEDLLKKQEAEATRNEV